MNDGEALLRAILDAPDDIRPRLVYADWLEENRKVAGAMRLRWWARTAPLLMEDLDRLGSAEDGRKEPSDRGSISDWRLKRLGCVLLARMAVAQCRVPWSKIDGWPEGWNSKRCLATIAEALHTAEWYALGLETDDGLVAATARVAAADKAVQALRGSAGKQRAMRATSIATYALVGFVPVFRESENRNAAARSLFARLAEVPLPEGW